jgi:hypothetical protein
MPARRRAARRGGDPAAPHPAGPLGPDDRAKFVVASLTSVVIGALIYMVCVTAGNLYKGTDGGYLGPDERQAVAQTHECTRTGPVSRKGFGYWWTCRVTVRMADGRTVDTTVDRSIVTPADGGRSVEFRESCKDGLSDCSYGRPTSTWVKGAVGALGMLEWLLIAVCAIAFVMLMLRGLLGVRRFVAIYDRSDRDRE